MKKFLILIPIIALFAFMSSCETYKDWKTYVKYSETYPVSGEWYVTDYDTLKTDSAISSPYAIYMYNKSFNPTKDSIWLDNEKDHPAGTNYPSARKFRIKLRANIDALTFDVTKAGQVTGSNTEPTSASNLCTITNSKIIDYDPGNIESAKADSIYFIVTVYNKTGVQIDKHIIAGHRKTGWENPNFSDDM